MLEPTRELWGASGARQGASGTPRKALGSSRATLWSALGCFRGVSGKHSGAIVSSAEKVKMLDLLFDAPHAKKSCSS